MNELRPKLLYFVSEDWYFWLHWANLARAARDAGWDVVVAARTKDHGRRIEGEGFRLVPIKLVRGSLNPLQEMAALNEIVRLYRRERPDVAHHVAMKPVLYGSVAARFARVHGVVNSFPGLGHAFIADGARAAILRSALRPALHWALSNPRSHAVFQNAEDLNLLIGTESVLRDRTHVIQGVGLNLSMFPPAPEPGEIPRVLLAGRMLWEKGVGEFVEAARLLRRMDVPVRCLLAGKVDEENPASVPADRLRQWQQEGIVEWLGHKDDMASLLRSVHIVVLPSYREGLPTVLLEAGACTRPVVASDVPGCREVVRDGENGLLVPAKDPGALANAIAKLSRDPLLRARMGAAGRKRVEREFSLSKIAGQTLALYGKILSESA